ncbi:hypothetical protein D5085_13265 [Ectothiorhodospiraceae bacterium BW-2]|nr:hypothetical protein D5085_13265 [Ectothiorhodospiraceae bacterium BW-2]
MNLDANLFSMAVAIGGYLLYGAVLLASLFTAPWHKVRSLENLNILLLSTALLSVVWQLKIGLHPSLGFHLLGATLFTLMFGWQFALMALTLILLVTFGVSDMLWPALGWSGLISVIIPILFSYTLLKVAQSHLPHNFFIYVLLNGFLCGGLSLLLAVGSTASLLLLTESYSWEFLSTKYLPFLPMMMLVEGFFSGMLITSLVIFRPEWVSTFDDRRYLYGK